MVQAFRDKVAAIAAVLIMGGAGTTLAVKGDLNFLGASGREVDPDELVMDRANGCLRDASEISEGKPVVGEGSSRGFRFMCDRMEPPPPRQPSEPALAL